MIISDMRKLFFFASTISLLFINTFLYGQKYVGAAKNDKYIQRAIKAIIQDAKNGDGESQYCIGMHYLNGVFLEKDTQTALKWLEKAKNNKYAKSFEFFADIENNDSIAEIYYKQAIYYSTPNDKYPISIPDIEYKLAHLTKNKRNIYIEVASKYLMGEFQECSAIGDSIDIVEDVYDAMIIAYSALSNQELAFEEGTSFYSSNFYRARFKAQKALDYLNKHVDDDLMDAISSQLIIDKLRSYSLAISCSKILQIPQHRLFLKKIHNRFQPIKSLLSNEMILQKLEIDLFEILYNLEKNNITLVCNELIPQFESAIVGLFYVDKATKSHIAMLYNQLSDYLNYAAIEEGNSSDLRIEALNVMIHSRDYSIFSKRNCNDSLNFRLIDWNEIKNSLPNNSMAFLFFRYSAKEDSWNYIWCFDSTSSTPNGEYGGHSYMSESQAVENILRNYKDKDKLFVVGTNSMMMTDYSNDNRIIHLHSISDILSQKQYYYNGNVCVIGNILYDYKGSLGYSRDKGAIEEDVGPLPYAKEEVQSIKNAFGGKVIPYQGEDVSHQTFMALTKENGILHISTHGILDEKKCHELNLENPEAGLTGDNVFRSCFLALSGYNDDHSRNSISAYEIKEMDLSGFDLVFISACKSGGGRILLTGDYSLAEAFRLAGIQNVIAVIDPIQDVIATKFAEHFYEQIANGISYHDAFYSTKKLICPNNRIILFE